MSKNSMAEMGEMAMPLPENTLPMVSGQGSFGDMHMGASRVHMRALMTIKLRQYRNNEYGVLP